MWSPPEDAAPPPAACAAAIRRVDGRASITSVPAGCWRVGPLVLGMTRAQVERRLGTPEAAFDRRSDAAHPRTYAAAVYLFPRRLAASLGTRPRARLPVHRTLDLLYLGGRLVRIDMAIDERVDDGVCPDGQPAPSGVGAAGSGPPAGFAPFMRFATMRIGEPIGAVARQIGPPATVSTAGDFRAYDPAPITIDGDARVGGFAIAADRQAQFEGFGVALKLHHRAGDCRIDGLAFTDPAD